MVCLLYLLFILNFYGYFGQISGCTTNCVKCDGNPQQCQECLKGYYIDSKYQCSLCPARCAECSSSTQCSKCKPNYWNSGCYSICDDSCDESGCEDTNGHCYNCPPGMYGTTCSQECSLCKNQLCDLRQCREGCIDGYFVSTLDSSTSCQKCPFNCQVCESSICIECKKGFYKLSYNNIYGNTITSCFSCHLNCEECTYYSACSSCKPGKYGSICDKNCTILNCRKCIETDGIESCTTCETGFILYDNKCGKCESNDGLCLPKCSNGSWGDNCDKECPDSCASCNQTNGICQLCHRDKYGQICQFSCNEHCEENGSTFSICDKDSGKCELGCKDGYSGDRCDLELSMTASVQTSSSSFWSSSSSTPAASTYSESGTATAQSLRNCEDGKTEIFVFGMIAGIGVCLIIGTGIGLIYFTIIRRRKNLSKAKDSDQREYVNTVGMSVIASPETYTNTEDNTNNTETDQTSRNVYERLETGVREEENAYTGLQ